MTYLRTLRETAETGHSKDWNYLASEEEDCFWQLWDTSNPKNHFEICAGESNQWAGKFIARFDPATVLLMLDVLDEFEKFLPFCPDILLQSTRGQSIRRALAALAKHVDPDRV